MTEKTLEIHLQELREQIAQEIEAMRCDVVHNESNPEACERMNFWYSHAASIARGRK